MQKRSFLSFLAPALAIDLGTVTTVVAMAGEGVVISEPSTVAVSAAEAGEILAIGESAAEMLGRTPGGVMASYPLRDGVITDGGLTEAMLSHFIRKALGRKPGPLGLRAMLCAPGCVTPVEKQALIEAARGAGARNVYVIEEAMAAAIGAALPVTDGKGSMIVDIGGGTTDVAVVAMGGIAAKRSVRFGGCELDEKIMTYVRRKHGVVIGAPTAERIKMRLGAAFGGVVDEDEVRGRNAETGLPAAVTVTAGEISFLIRRSLQPIVAAVEETLAATPPELAGDIFERGIMLAGGGAQLPGMCELISRATGIPARLAAHPAEAVALGALEALENAEEYSVSGLVS